MHTTMMWFSTILFFCIATEFNVRYFWQYTNSSNIISLKIQYEWKYDDILKTKQNVFKVCHVWLESGRNILKI